MFLCFQNSPSFYSDVNLLLASSLLSSITEPTHGQSEGCLPPAPDEAPPIALVPEEADLDKVESGGKRVCFKVTEDDQEDSGHDTMSYRDSYR